MGVPAVVQSAMRRGHFYLYPESGAQDLALKGETGVAAVVEKPSAPAQNASVAAKAKRDWLSANYALPLLPSMANMMQPAQARTAPLPGACTARQQKVYMTGKEVVTEAML